LQCRRFYIGESPRPTDAHAFRGSAAEIAFEDASPVPVKTHGPEGTGLETHPASDTSDIIDHHPVQDTIPVNGLSGADGKAGGIRAVHAGQGQVEIFKLIISHDAYAGQIRGFYSRAFP